MTIQKNIQEILVPVPLTNDFIIPLKQALYFHKVYGSNITLLNVQPEHSIFHRVMNPEKIRLHKEKSHKKLKKRIKNYFEGKIPDYIKVRIETGDLIQRILKTAETSGSDLIIIKKAARIGTGSRLFKKENSDRLISNAVCPVLTIFNRTIEQGIKDIMIPLDIFKKSTNKIAWAISLAQAFQSRLHLVSVLSMDIDPAESLAYKKGKLIEEQIAKEGIEVNMKLLKANKRSMDQVVLEYADELQPDLLLIMTHQESNLFDNHLGHFACEIIHNAHTPVFSVVPRKETLIEDLLSENLAFKLNNN